MSAAFLRTEIENKKVLAIDSTLPPDAFAKSGRAAFIKERGILLSGGTQSEWEIKGTYFLQEKGSVIFFGEDFEGENLLDMINSGKDSREETWEMLVACTSAISKSKAATAAAAKTGPAGIFRGKDGSVLIFPPELFSRCISSLPEKTAFETQGEWIHPESEKHGEQGNDIRALAFTFACCAYKTAAGFPPFHTLNGMGMGKEEEKTCPENFAKLVGKKAFVKIQDAVWGITDSTAGKINTLLAGQTTGGKKLTEETALKILDSFDTDFNSIFDPEKKGSPEPESFKQKFKTEETKIIRRIETGEKISKYRAVFAAAAAAVIVISGVFSFYYNKAKNYPDTSGLEAGQVVESFYEAVETLDQEIPKAYSLKKADNKYIELTTNIYLQMKIRQAMEIQNAWITPAFFYAAVPEKKTPALDGMQIYGITKLRMEKTRESGGPENPEKEEFLVSFFLWLPFFDSASGQIRGEETKSPPVTVYRCVDKVSLVFSKDKWLISEIETLENTALETGRTEIAENAEASAKGESALLPFAPDAAYIEEEKSKLTADTP